MLRSTLKSSRALLTTTVVTSCEFNSSLRLPSTSGRSFRFQSQPRPSNEPKFLVKYERAQDNSYDASHNRILVVAAVVSSLFSLFQISRQEHHADEEKKEDSVVEPKTGFALPKTLNGYSLVSTSARVVTFLSFVTYAFAFYISPEGDEELKTKGAGSVDPKTGLTDIALNSPHSKMIRIVPYRAIDATHFQHSLIEGLKGQYKVLNLNEVTLADSIAKFSKCFQTTKYEPKTTIDFVWAEGTLRIAINGNSAGSIADDNFAKAFFAMYLSAQPKTPDIRDEVAKGLSSRLGKK